MNLELREHIRKYFSDFRYLSSTEELKVIREFVRYEEVINFIEQYLDSLPKATMDLNIIPPGTVWYQGVFFFKYRLSVLQHLGSL